MRPYVLASCLVVTAMLSACASAPAGISTSVEGYIPFDGKLKIN